MHCSFIQRPAMGGGVSLGLGKLKNATRIPQFGNADDDVTLQAGKAAIWRRFDSNEPCFDIEGSPVGLKNILSEVDRQTTGKSVKGTHQGAQENKLFDDAIAYFNQRPIKIALTELVTIGLL